MSHGRPTDVRWTSDGRPTNPRMLISRITSKKVDAKQASCDNLDSEINAVEPELRPLREELEQVKTENDKRTQEKDQMLKELSEEAQG